MNDREKWRERVRDIRVTKHDMMMMMMILRMSSLLLRRIRIKVREILYYKNN